MSFYVRAVGKSFSTKLTSVWFLHLFFVVFTVIFFLVFLYFILLTVSSLLEGGKTSASELS